MKSSALVRVVVVLGVLFAGTVAVFLAKGLPAINEKQAELDEAIARTSSFEDLLVRAPAVADDLRESFAIGLGQTPDEIAHTLRSSLRAIAEQASLSNVTVTTGDLADQRSPAIRGVSRGAFRPLGQLLRSSPDFWTISGRIDGTGSLAQTHAAVVRLESQPWIARVVGVSIRASEGSADELRVTIDTASTVAIDMSSPDAELVMLAPDEGALDPGAQLAALHLFDAPPAPVPEPRAERPRPTTPEVVEPPYADWRFTGIVSGTADVAYFQNTRTSETIGLQRGEALLNVRFQDVVDGVARFRFEDTDFRILVGQTLADRTPEDQVDSPRQSGSVSRERSGQ